MQVVCEYCKSEITLDRFVVKAAEYRGALDDYLNETAAAAPIAIAGVRYALQGRLATGHSTEAWLGQRAARLGERVVIKVLRHAEDEPLLANEQHVLRVLSRSSERGSEFFSTLLPQRVAYGRCEPSDGAPTLAAVLREPIGFSHTLSGLRRALPDGIDARHSIWIWRRALELLSWVHSSGTVHGAVLPEHLLINTQDHGARLVGWSCAGPVGSALRAASAADLSLYPDAALAGGRLSPRTDLTMLARSLRATFDSPLLPAPLDQLLQREASGQGGEDAWALAEEVSTVARECFGASKFVALLLPRT